MNNKLLCRVNIGSWCWAVYNENQEVRGVVNVQNFAEDALQLCEDNGATVFHIFGLEEYAQGLAEELNRAQISKYSNQNIKVEVN